MVVFPWTSSTGDLNLLARADTVIGNGASNRMETNTMLIPMQYWVDGLLLQTITYGINITLFSACIYTLKRHLFKAIIRTERFHERHLLQNHLLTWFSVSMLTLSTIIMIYQGKITEVVWEEVLKGGRAVEDIVGNGSDGTVNLERKLFEAYCVSRLLVNWGLISFLVSVV